jgi:hypothetical protein
VIEIASIVLSSGCKGTSSCDASATGGFSSLPSSSPEQTTKNIQIDNRQNQERPAWEDQKTPWFACPPFLFYDAVKKIVLLFTNQLDVDGA